MGDAFSVPFILPCLWILKVVSMSVTKPGYSVRFLSFLFCYTPTRLPPTEVRVCIDLQAKNSDLKDPPASKTHRVC